MAKSRTGPNGPVFDFRDLSARQLETFCDSFVQASCARSRAMRTFSPTTSQLTIWRCSTTEELDPLVAVEGPVDQVSERKATLTVSATPKMIPNQHTHVRSPQELQELTVPRRKRAGSGMVPAGLGSKS